MYLSSSGILHHLPRPSLNNARMQECSTKGIHVNFHFVTSRATFTQPLGRIFARLRVDGSERAAAFRVRPPVRPSVRTLSRTDFHSSLHPRVAKTGPPSEEIKFGLVLGGGREGRRAEIGPNRIFAPPYGREREIRGREGREGGGVSLHCNCDTDDRVNSSRGSQSIPPSPVSISIQRHRVELSLAERCLSRV